MQRYVVALVLAASLVVAGSAAGAVGTVQAPPPGRSLGPAGSLGASEGLVPSVDQGAHAPSRATPAIGPLAPFPPDPGRLIEGLQRSPLGTFLGRLGVPWMAGPGQGQPPPLIDWTVSPTG